MALDGYWVTGANILVLSPVHLWSGIRGPCAGSRQQERRVQWTELGLSTLRIRRSLVVIAVFRLQTTASLTNNTRYHVSPSSRVTVALRCPESGPDIGVHV